VTGAASGIGRAASELFAEEGAFVLGVDIEKDELSFSSPSIAAFAMDVCAQDAPRQIVDAALSRFSEIDIVFSNAGSSERGGLMEISEEFWKRMLDVNLYAGFRLIRAAVPALKRSRAGRVIATASVAAVRSCSEGLGAYAASKAGLVGLVRNYALELGPFGITANCILPGPIMSKMTRPFLEQPEYAAAWANRAPLGRIGQPTDVARVALFLASDDSGYVTGQSIIVDGGISSVG
jgi:NAD(P)-dependent dehydrogenase (short-subunit alcohol dehydrogenase family)